MFACRISQVLLGYHYHNQGYEGVYYMQSLVLGTRVIVVRRIRVRPLKVVNVVLPFTL